ncbi:hypothetical protein RDI58_000077 [Solanum bulbocastanum]|uniref:Uncharacterized protein n=1 Tax=Solanum bulbocastanum TaxID=147425 RepID=A0AAN8U0Z5_SOLBU
MATLSNFKNGLIAFLATFPCILFYLCFLHNIHNEDHNSLWNWCNNHPILLANIMFFLNVNVLFWFIALLQSNLHWMIGLYWMVIPVMLLHFYANLPMAQYNQLRSWIVTILTWIWSIRMIHSYFRRENWQLGVKQDWRYTDMSNQYGKNWWWISFFAIYLSQQVLQMGICLPLYIIHSVDKPLVFLDFVAIAICLSGITIAFYADTELHNFITKNQKLQQLGQPMVPILDKGLWCYSRHPNYLGDHGGEGMSLWEALPTVAVVGGQSSGKSSVLESVVGRDFLPRGSGIVTRRPLVLQLHKTDGGAEYAEFLHAPKKKFPEFAAVRQEIADETDRITGKSKQISNVPIHLSIFSPNVVDLTLIDLPGLTKVAVEGQPESIVEDIEMMVRSYVEKPNCIILAISPANQDIATSDAIKLAREVDPSGERTFGVITKLDLMDQGTNALDVLEGRSYKLQHPWVGVVNRSQADINKSVDMMAARRKELEYFESSPEYGHLAHKMGAEYLAKLLSKHLETVIRQRIPSIIALINKTIDELNAELDRIGRPVGVDGGELKRFPSLQSDIAAAANDALDRFRDESRKTVSRLVEMESSYLTVEFFRKLQTEPEKLPANQTQAQAQAQAQAASNVDRYSDNHLRRIGSNVSAYINMVCETLKNTIPKAVVFCQVREARKSLLNHFYSQIGRREKEELGKMLDEDPALMGKRETIAKRLELYKSARDEIDAVAWK